jgi:arabinose-5-phosphate isomerase
VVSNSGTTAEIIGMLRALYRIEEKIPIIAITGNTHSFLARVADATLDVGMGVEACETTRAPTTSTTLQLVMGDCLAMKVMKLKGFTVEDFQLSHPGGALGST